MTKINRLRKEVMRTKDGNVEVVIATSGGHDHLAYGELLVGNEGECVLRPLKGSSQSTTYFWVSDIRTVEVYGSGRVVITLM